MENSASTTISPIISTDSSSHPTIVHPPSHRLIVSSSHHLHPSSHRTHRRIHSSSHPHHISIDASSIHRLHRISASSLPPVLRGARGGASPSTKRFQAVGSRMQFCIPTWCHSGTPEYRAVFALPTTARRADHMSPRLAPCLDLAGTARHNTTGWSLGGRQAWVHSTADPHPIHSHRPAGQFNSSDSSQCSYSCLSVCCCESSSAMACLMRSPSRQTSGEARSACSSSTRCSRLAISASSSASLR